MPKVARAQHTLDERITAHLPELSPAGQHVARYFAEHREEVAFLAVGEVSRTLKVSTATVVRTAQALGYSGIPGLKRELQQDIRRRGSPSLAVRAARTLDELAADGASGVDEIVAFHVRLLNEARNTLRPADLRRAVDVLDKAERIVVLSYPVYRALGDYFALFLKHFGRRAVSIGGLVLAEDLLELAPGDAVVMITYNQSVAVKAALSRARALRTPVVLVTDTLGLALKGSYTAVLAVGRGDPGRHRTAVMALFTLEVLLLWLAAKDRARSVRALEKLAEIRKTLPPL